MAVKQVGGSAVTATSTNNNGGSFKGAGGAPASGVMDAVAITGPAPIFGHVPRTHLSGATAAMLGSGVVATSVADGSGFCVFTKNSHGLAVGDVLSITGSTAASLIGIHKITAKDANTFTTDVPYAASATAGTYKLANGNYNTMTAGMYVVRKVCTELAGVANTTLMSGASDYGQRRSIHKTEATRSTFLQEWSWAADSEGHPTYTGVLSNLTTGIYGITEATDAPSTGDQAATPTRAVPGELVYRTGSPTPTQDNYKAKTG